MEFVLGIAPFGSTIYYQCLALRDEILRRPLGLNFDVADLEKENNDVHFYVKQGSLVVSTSILSNTDQDIAKMRQVATLTTCQNQGLGTLLLNYFEDYCRNHNRHKIVLHARKEAVNFYLKNNYSIEGEVFMEVGIEHYKMYKLLL